MDSHVEPKAAEWRLSRACPCAPGDGPWKKPRPQVTITLQQLLVVYVINHAHHLVFV